MSDAQAQCRASCITDAGPESRRVEQRTHQLHKEFCGDRLIATGTQRVSVTFALALVASAPAYLSAQHRPRDEDNTAQIFRPLPYRPPKPAGTRQIARSDPRVYGEVRYTFVDNDPAPGQDHGDRPGLQCVPAGTEPTHIVPVTFGILSSLMST